MISAIALSPSLDVTLLKMSMSSLLFGSVIAAGSASTGTPPELPSRFWISGFIVMSMKS